MMISCDQTDVNKYYVNKIVMERGDNMLPKYLIMIKKLMVYKICCFDFQINKP